MSGLLIVNADDYAGYPQATDRILACLDAGAITSTTAMMFTGDGERAARLAIARGIVDRIGLHLNLTGELDPTAPEDVKAQQLELQEHFADLHRVRWRVTPRLRRAVAEQIDAQLAEFRRLYGTEPTHVDSHGHAHVSPDVFLSPALRRGLRVRRPLDVAPGDRVAPAAAALRAVKRRAIAARFATTDRAYPIPRLLPALGAPAGRLDAVAAQLRAGRTVEIMCHPSFDGELPVLLDAAWTSWVARQPRGSFADLHG